MDNQICKVCGETDYFNFDITDDIWEQVAGEQFKNHVICLPCFDKLATKKNIKYVKHMSGEFYFVGETGTLIFEIKKGLINN